MDAVIPDATTMDSDLIDAPSDASADTATDTRADGAFPDAVVDSSEADADAALPSHRRVFLSERYFSSEIADALTADSLCQSEAVSDGLGGTWMAWLSDATTTPAMRFTHAAEPYRLLNGTLVASDWDDLTDGTLANPIDRSRTGSTVSAQVASNTEADGTANASLCDFAAGSGNHWFGRSDRTDEGWTRAMCCTCNNAFRLYCFEQ
jgi:hypothetical protein